MKKLTVSDPITYLKAQDAYTLHKPIRRKYKRRRYVTSGPLDLLQADLADMVAIENFNEGYKYLLVVIDVFSKFLWVKPLKSKSAQEVLGAMKMILMGLDSLPGNLMTDKGREFNNEVMKAYCSDNGINYYTSQNPDTKAAVAERVIRTIKSRLYRYFTHRKQWSYLKVLPQVVESYNNSKHRSIGMSPADVNKDTESAVRKKLYPTRDTTTIKHKFRVGDTVRIAREKQVFDKGYKQRWSDEIFTIGETIDTKPPVYKLEDYNKETIIGTFYEPELQSVVDTGQYQVSDIVRTRARNGRTEYLVRWKGYPESMNSWITSFTENES